MLRLIELAVGGVQRNGNVMARHKSTERKMAPKGTAPKKTWVVTTSSDRPISEIAKDLSAAGFTIDQRLDQIGVLTGKSDDQVVKKVRGIRGVADVSPDSPVNIGPPNSRDTW
jgi:hypothetical protein